MACFRVGVLVLLLLADASIRADPSSERARIEALIGQVEAIPDAAFIRNGKSYDASSAARFLRSKWHAHEAEVTTAEGFIEKVATVSSTTGEPYRIRFRDGQELRCADFLRRKLASMGVDAAGSSGVGRGR